jgi:hypothetical protein
MPADFPHFLSLFVSNHSTSARFPVSRVPEAPAYNAGLARLSLIEQKPNQLEGSRMPRGASPRREHEYEELKEEFKKSGRYKGREAEVASRIVNKQRAEFGETKEEKARERKETNPDRDVPIENYGKMKISDIERKAKNLSAKEIGKVVEYEKKHKNRKGAIEALEKDKQGKKAA